MCGIAGIWNLHGESLSDGSLEKFTDAIKERGPDGSGYDYFENRTLGLGHRRLSILDLSSAGRQPMYFADNRYAMTYNGEIYNFQELRTDLVKEGFVFKSDTDSEVIMAAFHHWGEDCMHKFNGMWAFAIWDGYNKELFLARDRFGIKPLYFIHLPGKMFAFSSESRSFKCLEGFQREFDSEMLALSAVNMRIQGSGYSIFKNMYQILPGHKAVLKQDDPTVNQKRWWHIQNNIRTDIPRTHKAREEEYYSIFRDACRMRLISDVPIGTALSGGLDSSSVYSTVFDILKKESLSRFSEDSQRAFVGTFPGLITDERAYAEDAIKFTGGPAVFIEQVFNNLPERIEKDTRIYDAFSHLPITSISSIYKGMKDNGIKVSLDGHGVDEMLYGYRDMLYNLFYYYFKKGKLRDAKRLKDIILPTYHFSEQDGSKRNLELLIKKASDPIGKLKYLVKKLIQHHSYFQDTYEQHTKLKKIGEPYDFSHLEYPEKMLYKETFTDTLPSLFRDFDRAAMANGIEIRMPFMDYRLVAYTFSLPITNKVGHGFNKLILRNAMKGKMSEDIRTRKYKIGIGSPVTEWFKSDLKTWALDILHSKEVMESPILGDNTIGERLEKAYSSGNLNNEIVREAWHEINLQLIK